MTIDTIFPKSIFFPRVRKFERGKRKREEEEETQRKRE